MRYLPKADYALGLRQMILGLTCGLFTGQHLYTNLEVPEQEQEQEREWEWEQEQE